MNWKKKHSEITLKTSVYPESASNHQNECVFVCTRKDYMRIMLLFKENNVPEDFPHAPQDKNTPKSKTQLKSELSNPKNLLLFRGPYDLLCVIICFVPAGYSYKQPVLNLL